MTPANDKLITLARAALARGGRESAAAVRDETGRTYVATQVDLPHLRLTALQAAVVVAASSGARRIEGAAVSSGGSSGGLSGGSSGGLEPVEVDPGSLALLADLALPGCVAISCDRSGRVIGVVDVSSSANEGGL